MYQSLMELFPQASLSGTVMTSGTVRRILLHGLPSSYFLTEMRYFGAGSLVRRVTSPKRVYQTGPGCASVSDASSRLPGTRNKRA